MKRLSLSMISIVLWISFGFGAEEKIFDNLRVVPRQDGSGVVDVYYDLLVGLKRIKEIEVSFNDGEDYKFTPYRKNLSGDIGVVLKGKDRHIVWDTQPELPLVVAKLMRIRLTATDDYVVDLTSDSSSVLPITRMLGALAVDPDRRTIVLFGGYSEANKNYLSDTWEWDGFQWKEMTVSGPSARSYAKMVYDKTRKRMVLFGGYSPEGPLGDTWEWDGSKWIPGPVSGPNARWTHAMAYDEEHGQTVLYGGYNYWGKELPYRRYSDTWIYDGQKWTSPAISGPSNRSSHSMAYDPIHRNIVLFGGEGKSPNNDCYSDTWLWNGREWTLAATEGPDARMALDMTFDEVTGDILMLGGRLAVSPFRDLWRWNGTDWSKLTDALLPTSDHTIVSVNGQVHVLRKDAQLYRLRYLEP